MKINDKVLSIPPYISTSWDRISSLSLQKSSGTTLIVELRGGKTVQIPNLSQSVIEAVFDMHAKYLEEDEPASSSTHKEELFSPSTSIPFKLGSIGIGGLDSLGSAMHHNPEQMDAPDLPDEILKKITSIARVLGMDDPHNLPKPEPHCNCMHCQIAKALQKSVGTLDENLDDSVSDADLTFRSWDIEQMSDNLYLVINPLDQKEKYNVFLGEPLGCTCGEKNCEHIKAVLNS